MFGKFLKRKRLGIQGYKYIFGFGYGSKDLRNCSNGKDLLYAQEKYRGKENVKPFIPSRS